MGKRLLRIACLIFLLCLILPVSSQAAVITRMPSYPGGVRPHNFWFWTSEKYYAGYAQWERVSGGLNFRIKMKNDFSESVDAYTFEISAKNVYEEPIMLKSSDGEYYESLYYTGERTFASGSNGYTEYFRLRSNEKIRYVYVKLIKYHTDEGTVYVDKDKQAVYHWKIN